MFNVEAHRVAPGGNERYILPCFGDRTPLTIAPSPGVQDEPHFSFDGKWLAVEIKVDGDRIRPGSPRILFPTQLSTVLPERDQYAVTPDGQRFLLLRDVKPVGETGPIPITVVVNWTASLKK